MSEAPPLTRVPSTKSLSEGAPTTVSTPTMPSTTIISIMLNPLIGAGLIALPLARRRFLALAVQGQVAVGRLAALGRGGDGEARGRTGTGDYGHVVKAVAARGRSASPAGDGHVQARRSGQRR